jgi:hypothetical protein
MEYNSTREQMIIPEYGRNIQKMIEYTITIEDRDRRNKAARFIVNVMAQMNALNQRDNSDFRHKLWDHIFIISDYRLDVDSPFPKPVPDEKFAKPQKCSYPHKAISFKQYGINIERMIKKAVELEDGDEKDALIKIVANHLKKLYLNWNRESVNDEVIIKHLSELSNGELSLSYDYRLNKTADILARNKKMQNNNNSNQNINGNSTGRKPVNTFRDKNKKIYKSSNSGNQQ